MNWLSNFGYSVVPDNVEVWNTAVVLPAPAASEQRRRLRVAVVRRLPRSAATEMGVTGGSDSHWVTTDAVAGHRRPDHLGVRHDHCPSKACSTACGLTTRSSRRCLRSSKDRSCSSRRINNGDGIFEAIAGCRYRPAVVGFRVRTVGAVPAARCASSPTRAVSTSRSLQRRRTTSGWAAAASRPGRSSCGRSCSGLTGRPRAAGCDPVVGSADELLPRCARHGGCQLTDLLGQLGAG